jgi:flagellar FliL protein
MSGDEMPDRGEGGEGGEGHKKAKSKVALLAIIGAVVLALIGGGGFLAASMMGKKKDKEAQESKEPSKEGAKEEAAPPKEEAKGGEKGAEGEGKHPGGGTFVSLDPIIVNLSGDEGKRFMKVTMQLEMATTGAVGEVQNKMPQIKDSVITLISSKSAEDLLTPDGKFKLKEQLITRVNATLTNGTVKNVFFVEFIIQ